MSEKRNCCTRDFSKYDKMETQELEAILRQDAEATDGQESDTEKILYIAGVLASRENENNTGNRAQIAWESFEKDYLPIEEESEHTVQSRKTMGPWVRRLTTIAAVFVLLIGLSATVVGAVGWESVWNAVAKWANETFSFVSDNDTTLTEPEESFAQGYASLQDALEATDQSNILVPTQIPDGYVLKEIVVDENPMQRVYIATYDNNTNRIVITVRSYAEGDPEKIEITDNLVEIYTQNGLECYILLNNNQLCAAWTKDTYECFVTGVLTLDELKAMLNSVGKG